MQLIFYLYSFPHDEEKIPLKTKYRDVRLKSDCNIGLFFPNSKYILVPVISSKLISFKRPSLSGYQNTPSLFQKQTPGRKIKYFSYYLLEGFLLQFSRPYYIHAAILATGVQLAGLLNDENDIAAAA